MENESKVLVIGGDLRYRWAVDYLRRQGIYVTTWGVPGEADGEKCLKDALGCAKTVLLPMKPLEEGMLCVGNEKVEAAVLPERMGRGSVLIAGTIPENLEGWLEERGIRCLCYLEQEDYLIKNAHLTAEGALYLALGHMEKTLWGSKVLVTGWGRIGKFLIPMLKQLGAEITVGVRKEAQKSLLEAMGYHVVTTGQFGSGLANYDLIINTVPGAVFSRDSIDSISLDCVLVELASLPGAFPEEIKNRVIFAPGLPGRTCPVTAGEILGKVVMDCLEGKGMNME